MMKNRGNCCVPGTSTLLLYFVVIAIAFGVMVYAKSKDQKADPKQLSHVMPELEIIRGNQTPPVDLDRAYLPTAEVIAKGKDLYQGGTCVGCHGAEGKGDGAAGQFLNPKPRSFASQEGWTNGTRVADIFKTLTDGIVERGMPAVDTLPVEDRFALVHYVRSMGKGYPEPSEAEKKELDTAYQLSKGQQEPHQVPISRAMAAMAKEAAQARKAVKKAIGVIEADYSKNHRVARIFRHSVRDINAAVSTLQNNTKWRKSPRELRNFWMANTGTQGLSTSNTTMADQDWRELYSYMLDIL